MLLRMCGLAGVVNLTGAPVDPGVESILRKMGQEIAYRGPDDEQIIRATLGRLLFSGDDTKKSVRVISGGDLRFLIGRNLGWNLIRSDAWTVRQAGVASHRV